jgi:multiple antibiotic resistance protein
MTNSIFNWKWGKLRPVGAALFFVLIATAVFSQTMLNSASEIQTPPVSIGKIFTFVFLTLGPLKIIGPFVEMTRGQDKYFKRKLAFRGILIAAIAMLVAATSGAKTLIAWGVSVGSLKLAAGIILFLVALTPVLEQFKPKKTESLTPQPGKASNSLSSLAFSPLAFPTIVTPYGIAVLILLATLRSDHLPEIAGVLIVILVLNFLAMLFADFILKSAWIAALLGIMGTVMGVLQVALGVQVIVDSLHSLNVV